MAKIIVEGWRFLPHSFAAINQFQCLELLRHPQLELRHRDMPYWNSRWQPVYGLLDAVQEQALLAIPAAADDESGDVTLRTGCPFDFSAAASPRTVTFATCEFGVLSRDVLGNRELCIDAGVRIITPSRWSREGLVRSGVDDALIEILPHGFDPGTFAPPTAEERTALRRKLGWSDYFIFLNVSAMTSNKGIPDILSALAGLAAQQPRARLMLKGLDSLYTSSAALNKYLEPLSPAVQDTLRSRVAYTGGDRSFREIAELYKAADAYVSPYLGEGFNLPVLEALACGLPVICTAGGSTDDFTTPDCTLQVRSRLLCSGQPEHPDMVYLKPDPGHLAECMERVMVDDDWRERARMAGPAHVHAHYTWRHIGDRLLSVLTG